MDAPKDGFLTGRRRFIALMGLAGFSSALRVPAALAQAATPKAAAPPDTSRSAAPEVPPEIADDAKALAGIVKRRYGQYLSDDDLKSVTEELQFRLQNGKRLRGAKLENGDEPDSTFHA